MKSYTIFLTYNEFSYFYEILVEILGFLDYLKLKIKSKTILLH